LRAIAVTQKARMMRASESFLGLYLVGGKGAGFELVYVVDDNGYDCLIANVCRWVLVFSFVLTVVTIFCVDTVTT